MQPEQERNATPPMRDAITLSIDLHSSLVWIIPLKNHLQCRIPPLSLVFPALEPFFHLSNPRSVLYSSAYFRRGCPICATFIVYISFVPYNYMFYISGMHDHPLLLLHPCRIKGCVEGKNYCIGCQAAASQAPNSGKNRSTPGPRDNLYGLRIMPRNNECIKTSYINARLQT